MLRRALLVSALASPTLAAPWWSNASAPVISFWYAPDNDWPAAVALVAAHAPLVTSVMSYCGVDLADDGTIIPAFHDTCASLFPALRALGVQTELATGSGNCSIDAMRRLWADTTASPRVLAAAVARANASGLNVDFEPQADACKGGATGTAADAALFARWLAAVRAALRPLGARLTVDVAGWSPVLREFRTLAAGVDRVLDMSTYNGGSAHEWDGYFDALVAGAPLAAAGVGLGGWAAQPAAWWATPAAAAYKVAAAARARVPELAVFRIVPSPEQAPEWPLAFWWDALEKFV